MNSARWPSLIAALAIVAGCFHSSQPKLLGPADPALEPTIEQSSAKSTLTVTSAEPAYVALLFLDSGTPFLFLSRTSRNMGASARSDRHEFVFPDRYTPNGLPMNASVMTCKLTRNVQVTRGTYKEVPIGTCQQSLTAGRRAAFDQYAIVVVSDRPMASRFLASSTSQILLSSDPDVMRERLAERLFSGATQRWSIEVFPLVRQ